MTTDLEWALSHIKQGFRVLPVKVDKTPLTAHGLKEATETIQGVREYWGRFPPDAGIGITTDGFLVLDFDAKNGGLESLKLLQCGQSAHRAGAFPG